MSSGPITEPLLSESTPRRGRLWESAFAVTGVVGLCIYFSTVTDFTKETKAHTDSREQDKPLVPGFEYLQSDVEAPCKDWAGTWSFSPTRPMYTGSLSVTQEGCNVTLMWWESVYDWECHGQQSLTGWIEVRADYKARGQVIIIPNPMGQAFDYCGGWNYWRPREMKMWADGRTAAGTAEVWRREPLAPPNEPLPRCLPQGECAISFLAGFSPPCCEGLVRALDYSGKCHHRAEKYGYPEVGLSCQTKQCLDMGKDCYHDRKGCCPGMSCDYEGISGWQCG